MKAFLALHKSTLCVALFFTFGLSLGLSQSIHADTLYSGAAWLATGSAAGDSGPCVGDIGDVGPEWTQPGFDDSGWQAAYSPIGGDYHPPGVLSSQLMWVQGFPLQAYFRYTLPLVSQPSLAHARLWADDNLEFYVNGVMVDHDRSDGAGDHPWGSELATREVDIAEFLGPGNNVLAIRGWDGSYCNVIPRGGRVLYFELEYEDVPKIACDGFEPPMADGPVKVKGNRALPLKAQLYDAEGYDITGSDLDAPPVLQLWYEYGTSDEDLVEIDALPAGQGDEGNLFVFTDDEKWQFNLKTSNYTASGTYTVFMESGDDSEYVFVEPSCMAEFVVK